MIRSDHGGLRRVSSPLQRVMLASLFAMVAILEVGSASHNGVVDYHAWADSHRDPANYQALSQALGAPIRA
jgi:hypothetical protein